MSSSKLVKNFFILALLVFLVMAQTNGNRIDEEPDDADETRTIYDQRQTGKYNIHVVIKDVAIIEMDQNEVSDNYGDEEYYYDEGDLTIKPINLNPTTPTNNPSNSTATITRPTKSTSSTKVTPIPFQSTIFPEENPNTESTLISKQEITTLSSSILWNTLIPTTMSSTKAPNIVVLNTNPPAIDIKARSKIEPIYAIDEPVLHPKHHLLDYNYGMPPQPQSRDGSQPIETKAKALTNSKIYKVKVHRSHQPHPFTTARVQRRRCRSHQYRDSSGNCRGKRSSSGSILKRLFSMLVTLPFVRGEQINED